MLVSDSLLVEGSLMDVLVRCGRKGCHCEEKPLHPVTRLSRWENGKLKNKVVRIADRELIRKLSANYKEHKKALNDLARLNAEEIQLLKSVMKLKNVDYE
jgi:hypothetical protein